jgi:N-acetylglucosaminyldiphosphoundecaprenol N-acetyl-beta-D-mannosaminyltransferase
VIPRVDVLGVGVSAINQERALAEITSWIERRERHYVCVTGVHGVMESQRDPDLLAIHNSSGMTTPDGMPLVWCARYAGIESVGRVYGPDLMLNVSAASTERGWTHYYYGAAPGVPELLAENLKASFPGLKVVGTHSPPFRDLNDDEVGQIAEEINHRTPEIVWVGLSTPKQERWMARLRPLLEAPVLIGVGAAFDIHAGRLEQAPSWMQKVGMEWAFRLSREPKRLWKRYLVNNPAFIAGIIRKPPHVI